MAHPRRIRDAAFGAASVDQRLAGLAERGPGLRHLTDGGAGTWASSGVRTIGTARRPA
ncbi:hypothetical protein [Planotetraspora mira]|uniref:hypothetical protein n=1 Tax=Planotetraspora mira TaxID=58121 RepID=UPI00195013CF|nr:hypothetical protein [Planotetraspora mira]